MIGEAGSQGGEAGQGKSSLVNGLIGSQRAREGGSLKSVTKKAASFDLSRNGVDCTVWDTPGFGYESEEVEERFLNELGVYSSQSLLTIS